MKISKFAVFILFLQFFIPLSYAQNIVFSDKILWDTVKSFKVKNAAITEKVYYLTFRGSIQQNEWKLPEYQKIIPLAHYAEAKAFFIHKKFKTINKKIYGQHLISNQIKINAKVYFARHKPYLIVDFVPIRKSGGQLQLLDSFTIKIVLTQKKLKNNFTVKNNSVLSTGYWVKIGIPADGVYKLTFQQLKDLGFTNPRNVRVFGNDFGQLGYNNSDPYPDDLYENKVYYGNDYILFYARGSKRWFYDTTLQMFNRITHDYSDTAYYFLTDKNTGYNNVIALDNEENNTVTHQSNQYLWFTDYEKDQYNILKSGRLWFCSKVYHYNTKQTYTFQASNILPEPAKALVAAVGRTFSYAYYWIIGGNDSTYMYFPAINGHVGTDWGRYKTKILHFTPTDSDKIQITLRYQGNTTQDRGLLDYIVVNAYRKLVLEQGQVIFSDPQSTGESQATKFILENVTNQTQVWDITDPIHPQRMKLNINGSTGWFVAKTDSLRQFIAFNPTEALSPVLEGDGIGHIPNQNIHAIPAATQMLIITHPEFKAAAQRIADLHTQVDHLNVKVVTTEQIYNEFSSGMRDLVAIRNFIRAIYWKPGSQLKWVLLLGDGSYKNKPADNNPLFIPTYQTLNSLNTDGYLTMVSDDFLTMMDPNEGDITNLSNGLCDLNIGRLPVETEKQANDVARKIEFYLKYQNKTNWKNYLVLIADDASQNIFMQDAEQTSNNIYAKYPEFKVKKIYLDAYPAQINFGGEEYPGAVLDIKNRVQEGSLIISYLGHGNETVLASERVITISDVRQWKNLNRLSFFITGTCEFGRYDIYEPTKIERSAGEELVLNPQGGAIAMLTTTRISYSSVNFYINYGMFDHAFDRQDGHKISIGEIIRRAKFDYNSYYVHEFALLGDPALKLAYPENRVQVDTVKPDMLKPLSKVTITGKIRDTLGNVLTNFNGVLYATVYDKPQYYWTLDNDNLGAFQYKDYKNIVFNGKVTVTNGQFSLTFIVPKDIDYNYGVGKVVFYAADGGNKEAIGAKSFIIGGKPDSVINDKQGPQIRLFLNDTNFVNGSVTDQNPTVLAYLSDQTGINTTNWGLGHELRLILDGKTYIVNDYFESNLDSYNSGVLKYSLAKLSPGKHTLTLKAFDLLNNPSQKTIEFYVVKDNKIALHNVLNYPNPFVDKTAFYFELNQVGKEISFEIQIFTLSGRLVRTIVRRMLTTSYLIGPVYWDGLDDYGQKIGRGVYIYILTVKTSDGKVAKYTGKLLKI